MAEKFIRAQQKLYHLLAKIAGGMIMFAALLACINVISRYCFNHSFSWAEELCTYICSLVIFLVYAWLETEDQQLCIDLISSTVKNKKFLAFLYILRGIVTLMITAILIRYGVASLATAFKLHTVSYVLKLPRYVMYAVIIFGYFWVMLGWLSVLLLNKGRKFE